MLFQVSTAAVEQYTGEGKPPYCEMTLRGVMPDGTSPPKFILPVTITGVNKPTTITLERKAHQSLEELFANSDNGTGKLYAQTKEMNINVAMQI